MISFRWKIDRSRKHVQKRLILCRLSELYVILKEENASVKVSLSKFSQLIPCNCVLAAASGTHTVCVCVHHENVNLMLDAINIEKLTCETNNFIASYHDTVEMMICNALRRKTPERLSVEFRGEAREVATSQ